MKKLILLLVLFSSPALATEPLHLTDIPTDATLGSEVRECSNVGQIHVLETWVDSFDPTCSKNGTRLIGILEDRHDMGTGVPSSFDGAYVRPYLGRQSTSLGQYNFIIMEPQRAAKVGSNVGYEVVSGINMTTVGDVDCSGATCLPIQAYAGIYVANTGSALGTGGMPVYTIYNLNENVALVNAGITSLGPTTTTTSLGVNLAGNTTIFGKLEFTEDDIFSSGDCTSGKYYIVADASETTFKKCINGTFSDLEQIASLTVKGIVSTTTQSFGGTKTFEQIAVNGPVLANGPTSTPPSSPTPTGATPTATAVTPTPTATSTAFHKWRGNTEIDGDLTFIGNVARNLKVGSCPLAPCTGAAFAIQAGDAVGLLTKNGGAASLKGGGGTVLGAGGDVTLEGGSGFSGSNINLTAVANFSGAFSSAGRILVTGNLTSKQLSTAVAISSCGSGASVTGTNNTGTITTGTGATSCTLTFGRAFANIPPCFANNRTGVLGVRAVPTASAVVFDTLVAASISSSTIDYWCIGRE